MALTEAEKDRLRYLQLKKKKAIVAQSEAASSDLPPIRMSLEEMGKSTAVQDEMRRQLGLAARYGVEGALSLPSMAGDAMTAPFGLKPTSQALSDLLTRVGLPQPQGPLERIVGDASRGMAGGALFGPAAIVPSGASAGASGAVREMGGGPAAQLVAGIVTPFAVDALRKTIVTAYYGAKAAGKPFYQSGREQIAGTVLTENAADATAAKQALKTGRAQIPGSRPTTVQVTRDPGLATVERGLRSSTPKAGAMFAQREAEQNRARQILLDRIAQDKTALEAAFEARDSAALPILHGIRQGDAVVDAYPVIEKIDGVLAGEAGKRTVVKNALKEIRDNLFSGKEPEKTFERLYGVRKDISDMIEGRVSGDRASHKYAAKELIEIRDALDDQIQKVFPQFAQYREAFREGSRTINQIQLGQDIAQKATTAATTSMGDHVISAAKWRNVVTQNRDELAKTMTPMQMRILDRIGRDLDAGAYAATGGKAAGSNTMQNFSTAYLIGTIVQGHGGSTFWQTVGRPFSFLTKLQDTQVNELLTDAMLDPRLARALMLKATPRNAETVGKMLAARAKEIGIGIAAGQISQQER